jgi:hypothetical protein
MSEAPEPLVNVKTVADPMAQIEYWQLRHQHWRRLALWSFAALGIILVLSVVHRSRPARSGQHEDRDR